MCMTEQIYPVSAELQRDALINKERYQELYKQSVNDPDTFWAEQAEQFLTWQEKWHTVSKSDLNKGEVAWFLGGKLNVSVNCIDRHLDTRADQVAIIWEGDDPAEDQSITYRELSLEVNRLANLLRARGVKKGDRVCLYLPMVPEACYAMLACSRIGAVHSVVFGGFSPDALKDRILNADCRILITADEGLRGGRRIPLKANADKALAHCPEVHTCLVLQRTGADVAWDASRDVWYHEAVAKQPDTCEPEIMDAEDPLFILYTSGSTGKPKGVLHTTGGYLLQTALSHKYVFDHREGDVYWCTADVGWVTGHSYIVYGPLANGATTLVFEGVPTYPDPSRFWQVIDKHKVNSFYTAPTAIRALIGQGDEYVTRTSRASLRILGSVGEPINPEAWEWYHRVVGDSRCPIVDTWWQTENGGILIAPLPGATDLKPGSATRPLFGVKAGIVDNDGNLLEGVAEGNLVILDAWPGIARSIWGDHERFIQTYFATYPGMYFTGDGARRDEDDYYWITGRVDDVLNVSGHRMGTAEIESALVAHEAVAEAAVVGFPHDIKGQGIYIYVTLNDGFEPSEELQKELVKWIRTEIGPISSPDILQWASDLPKTRSGKIMRRILRKIAANECDGLGDTSTLADPSVVEELIENRANK